MLEYDPNPCYERRRIDLAHMTVAIAMMTYRYGSLQILMSERSEEPHKGTLALPASYVREGRCQTNKAEWTLSHKELWWPKYSAATSG